MNKERELRYITTNIELRTADDGKEECIEGYALKFERWSNNLGWFREIISSNALDNTDFTDVVALFNHNTSQPLARNTVKNGKGSLELTVDGIGLRFKLVPTNTSYGADLIENMRAGVVNKCSFAFCINWGEDNATEWSWNEVEKIDERRINDIAKITDISIVTRPAYDDTESIVSKRSLDVIKKIKEERNKSSKDEIIKRKLEIELELI